MKKIYTLFVFFIALAISSNAQVLLFEDFQEDSATFVNRFLVQNAAGNDTTWLNSDLDGAVDASGSNLPTTWFRTVPFATADTLNGNLVMASNSWTTPVDVTYNYLILPPIHLNDASGMFSWKTAPRQTPRYLDGLQVLLSTSQNFENAFTDTLRNYAECICSGGDSSSNFSDYTFSNGFVFGQDGQYIEYLTDSFRFRGILRPDSVSLSGYSGQTIYIAFLHGSTDDYLISIDDIKITGNGTVLADIPANHQNDLYAFPNPANEKFTIEYSLPVTGPVSLNVFDLSGKKVKSILNNICVKGDYTYDIDVIDLPAGIYNVVLKTMQGEQVSKITKM